MGHPIAVLSGYGSTVCSPFIGSNGSDFNTSINKLLLFNQEDRFYLGGGGVCANSIIDNTSHSRGLYSNVMQEFVPI